MTWILGVNAPGWAPGSAVLAGDTRASWPGRHLDCLQKIHRVGNQAAVGFAGSVELGFAAIEALRGLPALDARAVMRQVRGVLRKVWDAGTPRNQELGLDVIVAHASPAREESDTRSSSIVCRFLASRRFELELTNPGAAVAIGSGARPFADALQNFQAPTGEQEPIQKALDRFGGWLRFMLTRHNRVATVAPSAFAVALTQTGAIGPRLYALDRALTNTMNVPLPMDGAAANFTAADDGSFDFSVELADGRLTTVVALTLRETGELALAREAAFKREDYAENLPELLQLAASRGLRLTSAEASDARAAS